MGGKAQGPQARGLDIGAWLGYPRLCKALYMGPMGRGPTGPSDGGPLVPLYGGVVASLSFDVALLSPGVDLIDQRPE